MEKLINWRELSTLLTGNPENIRKNRVPKKYRDAVSLLLLLLDFWKLKNDL